METLMSVVCEAVPGRDREMNDWYSWVHIRDVMGLPGSIAVQRFARAAIQPLLTGREDDRAWSYLALYEVDDKEACSQGHRDNLNTDRMPISDSFDTSAFHEAYYDPVDGLADRDFSAPGGNRAVLHVGLRASPGSEELVESEFRGGLMDSIRALPGVASSSLFRHGTGQMLTLPPAYSHVLVCHLDDLSLALASWDEFVASRDTRADNCNFAEAHTAAYVPVMQRLRASDVLAPTAASTEIAARARAALSTRVFSDEDSPLA